MVVRCSSCVGTMRNVSSLGDVAQPLQLFPPQSIHNQDAIKPVTILARMLTIRSRENARCEQGCGSGSSRWYSRASSCMRRSAPAQWFIHTRVPPNPASRNVTRRRSNPSSPSRRRAPISFIPRCGCCSRRNSLCRASRARCPVLPRKMPTHYWPAVHLLARSPRIRPARANRHWG